MATLPAYLFGVEDRKSKTEAALAARTVVPTLERLRQEDCFEFTSSLEYTVNPQISWVCMA